MVINSTLQAGVCADFEQVHVAEPALPCKQYTIGASRQPQTAETLAETNVFALWMHMVHVHVCEAFFIGLACEPAHASAFAATPACLEPIGIRQGCGRSCVAARI